MRERGAAIWTPKTTQETPRILESGSKAQDKKISEAMDFRILNSGSKGQDKKISEAMVFRILNSGSKAQDKKISEAMVFRILVFTWSVGRYFDEWTRSGWVPTRALPKPYHSQLQKHYQQSPMYLY